MLVIEGEVELYLPFELAGATRGFRIDRTVSGSLLGWSSLVQPNRCLLSARSTTQVEALVCASADLLSWFDRAPTGGTAVDRAISNALGRRLQAMSLALRGEIEHSIRLERRDAPD